MSRALPETAITLMVDRHFPASATLDAARAIEASGATDYLAVFDQMAGWCPPHLWTPENSPLYSVRQDADSLTDGFAMLSAMAAVAPTMGTVISTDSIRRGPSELMQTMLTLAHLTQGRAQFHIGAGEIKQTRAYGWRRSEGMKRLEDVLQIAKLFWEEDEPFDFEGHYWTLDQATLGTARPYKPQIWGIGGGPKMYDLCTTYADGFGTCVPWVAHTPERWHEMVAELREQLERKGRDPDEFQFGIYAAMLLHDDPDVIEASLGNPFIKWSSACLGRFKMSDWQLAGIDPPLPLDWHYSRRMLPHHMSAAEIDAIVGRVTPEMARASWLIGGPQEIAAQLQGYVDAGATWINICDVLPAVLEPSELGAALGRALRLSALLRQGTGAAVPAAHALAGGAG
jgi:phthiodiolone/phenolphthiodiolone dimycocerosates ketoreductase